MSKTLGFLTSPSTATVHGRVFSVWALLRRVGLVGAELVEVVVGRDVGVGRGLFHRQRAGDRAARAGQRGQLVRAARPAPARARPSGQRGQRCPPASSFEQLAPAARRRARGVISDATAVIEAAVFAGSACDGSVGACTLGRAAAHAYGLRSRRNRRRRSRRRTRSSNSRSELLATPARGSSCARTAWPAPRPGRSVMLMTFLTISVSITSSITRTKSASRRLKSFGVGLCRAPRKASHVGVVVCRGTRSPRSVRSRCRLSMVPSGLRRT